MINDSLELHIFCRDLLEGILISISKDWNNQIEFKKENSKIKKLLSEKKYFDSHKLYELIERLAYMIFLKGKANVYYKYAYNKKNEIESVKIYTSYDDKKVKKESYDNKQIIKFSNIGISNINRKRLLIMLKNMNCNKFLNEVNEKNDTTSSVKFFSKMTNLSKLKTLKLTKNVYNPSYNSEYMTDFYFAYRLIKMRIYQRKFVDYIATQLTMELQRVSNDNDEIIINGITVESLNKYLEMLIEQKLPISKILSSVYNRENI